MGCIIAVIVVVVLGWAISDPSTVGGILLLVVLIVGLLYSLDFLTKYASIKKLQRTPEGRAALAAQSATADLLAGGWKKELSSLFVSKGLQLSDASQLRDPTCIIATNSDYDAIYLVRIANGKVFFKTVLDATEILSVTKDFDVKRSVSTSGSSNMLYFGNVGLGGTKLKTDVNSKITAGYLSLVVSHPANPLVVLSMDSTQDTETWAARIEAIRHRAIMANQPKSMPSKSEVIPRVQMSPPVPDNQSTKKGSLEDHIWTCRCGRKNIGHPSTCSNCKRSIDAVI